MKLKILNTEGKKVKEKDSNLFEEPVRFDIISKVVEAEKLGQPYSPRYRAGMDISASGNVRHTRHSWKSDRGRGMSRIPRKAFWRRGTQFSWEGAIIPSTKGGRRAHPPKGAVKLKKINKKELKKALLSALSYVSKSKELEKKYDSLMGKKIDKDLPIIVEDKIFKLKTNEFLESLRKILGDLFDVAIQRKSVRAGVGTMRGRKYKRNAGMLFVIADDEDKKFKGIDFVHVRELSVSDLASNGARLTLFSEKAVEELNEFFTTDVVKKEKEDKKKVEDKRKIKREGRKKKIVKTGKSTKDKARKSEGESKSESKSLKNTKENKENKENA